MDIEYALAHADALIRERVITDIHVAIVATLATEVRRLQKIESAALCCDGIDMGDYYQLPVAAFEDLLNSLRWIETRKDCAERSHQGFSQLIRLGVD